MCYSSPISELATLRLALPRLIWATVSYALSLAIITNVMQAAFVSSLNGIGLARCPTRGVGDVDCHAQSFHESVEVREGVEHIRRHRRRLAGWVGVGEGRAEYQRGWRRAAARNQMPSRPAAGSSPSSARLATAGRGGQLVEGGSGGVGCGLMWQSSDCCPGQWFRSKFSARSPSRSADGQGCWQGLS